ncbi:hypothetical protein ACEQUB_p00265 (plasmid) [Ralstonia syzygii]
MPKRSFRFPSILARHATQPVRDATAQDTGTPTTAPRRQRQGVFCGLLPLGRRRGADGPLSTGTQAGSAPRVTAGSPAYRGKRAGHRCRKPPRRRNPARRGRRRSLV